MVGNLEPEENLMTPDPGSLSVVVLMEDMEDILVQMWKSRGTEPRMGELYKKYKPLVPPFEEDD